MDIAIVFFTGMVLFKLKSDLDDSLKWYVNIYFDLKKLEYLAENRVLGKTI